MSRKNDTVVIFLNSIARGHRCWVRAPAPGSMARERRAHDGLVVAHIHARDRGEELPDAPYSAQSDETPSPSRSPRKSHVLRMDPVLGDTEDCGALGSERRQARCAFGGADLLHINRRRTCHPFLTSASYFDGLYYGALSVRVRNIRNSAAAEPLPLRHRQRARDRNKLGRQAPPEASVCPLHSSVGQNSRLPVVEFGIH